MTFVTARGEIFKVRVNAVPPPPGGLLADAVASLAVGSAANFPIPTWNAAWGSVLTQTTRFHWDPAAAVAWLWGQDAGYGSLIRYDAAANAFARVYHGAVADWGGTASGRAYDSSCLDNDGAFYIMPPDGQLRRFNGSTFDAIGTPQAAASTHFGLGFHLNLYGSGQHGFIAVRGSYIRHMPKAGGTWSPISGGSAAAGTNYASALYVPAWGGMSVTQGAAGTSVFTVNPGASPGRAARGIGLPISCSATAGANTARIFPSPNRAMILENAVSGQVWHDTTAAGPYALQTYTHPLQLTDGNWAAAYLSTFGVFWSLRTQAGSTPSSILWRPGSGS